MSWFESDKLVGKWMGCGWAVTGRGFMAFGAG